VQSLPLTFAGVSIAFFAAAIALNLWTWFRHRKASLRWYAFLTPGVSLRDRSWITPSGHLTRRLAERCLIGGLISLGLALLSRFALLFA
jgi:hypothetical protein